MFIPDPGSEFFHPGFRVKKDYRMGIRIRNRMKEFKYINPKNCFLALGNMIRDVNLGFISWIRILIFYPSRILGKKRRIPDPDPQHCFLSNFEGDLHS
jgi:hypothetical protein